MPATRTGRRTGRRKAQKPPVYYHQDSNEESEPETEYEAESEKWEIEYIQGARVNEKNLWEYWVKWADFPDRFASWEPADGGPGGLNETRQYLEDFHKEAEDQGFPLNMFRPPGFQVIARPKYIEAAKESFREHRKRRQDTGLEDSQYYEEKQSQMDQWCKKNNLSIFTIKIPAQRTSPPQNDTSASVEDINEIDSLRISEDPDPQTLSDTDSQFELPPPFDPSENPSHIVNSPEPDEYHPLFDAQPEQEFSHRRVKIFDQPDITSGSHLSTKKRINQGRYAPMYSRSVSPELGVIPNAELNVSAIDEYNRNREWSVDDSEYQC